MRRAMVLCTDHVVTPAHLMFDDWLTGSVVIPATAHSTPPQAVTPPQAARVEAFSSPACTSADNGESTSTVTSDHAPAHAPNGWADMSSQAPSWTLPTPEAAPCTTDLQSAARMNEHQVIMATLAATPSKTEAAKRLGISPRTLRYKLAQLREHGLSMASAY
jgi:two-component system response regulator FlrC